MKKALVQFCRLLILSGIGIAIASHFWGSGAAVCVGLVATATYALGYFEGMLEKN